jgi:single-strand DNA-binding protein
MHGIECAFMAKVGTEPELKMSSAGKPWLGFNAAVGSGDETQWLRVAAFGDRAQELANDLHKGDKIYVEGRLTLRTWEKDGQTQAGLNIAAWRIEKLGLIGRNKPARPKNGETSPALRRPPDPAVPKPQQPMPDDPVPF